MNASSHLDRPVRLPALAVAVLLAGCMPAGPTPLTNTGPVVTQSGNHLDWLIDGPGYFQFKDPDTGALSFSRRGAFTVDGTGTMIHLTRPTRLLDPTVILDAPTPDRVYVTVNGLVLVASSSDKPTGWDSSMPTGDCSDCVAVPVGMKAVGSVRLAVFSKPDGLQPQGNGFFVAPTSGAAGEKRLVSPSIKRPAVDAPWDQAGRLVMGSLEGAPTAPNGLLVPIPIGVSR